jgi:membrane-associated PAP2 superfamily phosphatase
MPPPTPRIALPTAAVFLALLGWDASRLDLRLAALWADGRGFSWRDHWLLATALHEVPKACVWALIILLCIWVAHPPRAIAFLPRPRRLQFALVPLLAWGAIALLRTVSQTSCPWDLRAFGGEAQYVSHWLGWIAKDGGHGHCFPALHATTGFAFVVGYFALRGTRPAAARWWLVVPLVAGILLGVSQQVRGAHFMSHTLWSGWICWMVAWATDPLFRAAEARAPVGAGAGALNPTSSAQPADRPDAA